MSNMLPEELCYEILLCVPAEPLFSFRTVCKSWCRIIDDTNFIKTHFHCQQEGGDHLLIRRETEGKLYSLALSSIDFYTGTSIKNLVGYGVPEIEHWPVTACNGIALITHRDEYKAWTLWNPFTNNSTELPPDYHLRGKHPCWTGCGIGYDSSTNDLKVVRNSEILNHETGRFEQYTSLYSLKSNCWKSIPNFQKLVIGNGVFVNGALHWISGENNECIIAFNLTTEENHVLPCPSYKLPQWRFKKSSLLVLGGCLCLRSAAGLWIMKDYEVHVWTKLVSAEDLPIGVPIAYIKNKEQVLFQQVNNNVTELLLFNLENKCAKKVQIKGFYEKKFTSQVIRSSLFRLNKGGKGDGSMKGKLKRKRDCEH